ncbi:ankyrin repeat-containing protein BDA1-like [Fagus crenata]
MGIRHEEDEIIELYNAAASGCTTTFYSLIHKDPHLLNKISLTSLSETPLHISALVGHLDFSRALLHLKPQLAIELDTHRRCPLHLASAEGQVEIAQALLHANDDACLIRDQDGRIPLHYAAMRGRVEVVRELIVARPDSTQVVLDGGETVLHLCVKYNQLEALKLLVESVIDEGEFLNSKDHEGGNTILHLAVMLEEIETVKYLLSVVKVKEGANALNKKGFTALELSEHSPTNFKSFSIVKILMAAGLTRGNEQNNLPPPLEIVGATVGGNKQNNFALTSETVGATAGGNEQNNFPPPSATVGAIVGGSEQNNLSPPSATVVDVNESANPSRASKKMSKWLEHLRYQGNWIEEMPGALMVVATVISTITFQPAISPPGGVWQTDVTDPSQGYTCSTDNKCYAGTSVMGSSFFYLYQIFIFCNTISFTASLSVIFLLISGFPFKNKVCMGLLTLAMCTTITFLALAYVSAIVLVFPTNLFHGLSQNIITLIPIGGLAIITVVVLLIHIICSIDWLVKKIRKFILLKQR